VLDVVNQLLATQVALDKLEARGGLGRRRRADDLEPPCRGQEPPRQFRAKAARRLVIGCNDAGRVLTLVIEESVVEVGARFADSLKTRAAIVGEEIRT
jgi:hypothetical protein